MRCLLRISFWMIKTESEFLDELTVVEGPRAYLEGQALQGGYVVTCSFCKLKFYVGLFIMALCITYFMNVLYNQTSKELNLNRFDFFSFW